MSSIYGYRSQPLAPEAYLFAIYSQFLVIIL